MDTRTRPTRPRDLVRSRPPQGGARRYERTRPGGTYPPPYVRQASQHVIVIRRRAVRPFVGPREFVAILTLIVACFVTLQLGAGVGSMLDEVMSISDGAQLDVASTSRP